MKILYLLQFEFLTSTRSDVNDFSGPVLTNLAMRVRASAKAGSALSKSEGVM